MNIYGFPYNNIFNLLSIKTSTPANNPTNPANFSFNPLYNTPYTFVDDVSIAYGAPVPTNCNSGNFTTGFPSWISDVNSKYDLRGAYVKCNNVTTLYENALPNPWPATDNVLQTISPITGLAVPYTTESIFYAQSGYFVTVVMVQWSNVFACKSRKVYFTINFRHL